MITLIKKCVARQCYTIDRGDYNGEKNNVRENLGKSRHSSRRR